MDEKTGRGVVGEIIFEKHEAKKSQDLKWEAKNYHRIHSMALLASIIPSRA